MLNSFFKYLFLFGFFFFYTNCAKKIVFSMVTSSSINETPPFYILEGKEWKSEVGAAYVKVHFFADEPFNLSKIELETCSKLQYDSTAYINFDEKYAMSESENKNIYQLNPPVSARSVTINFSENNNICLTNIKFFDEKGKIYKPVIPKIVKGNVVASETAKPENSYSVLNIFDSKFENAYASVKGGEGVTITFELEENQKVSVVRLWNGYQRSDVHCIKNGRLKEFTLSDENGNSAKVQAEDIMGAQDIPLPSTLKGKKFILTVNSIYQGLTDNGFVISEFRMGHDKEWFVVDTLAHSQKIASENTGLFRKASLEKILNHQLDTVDTPIEQTQTITNNTESENQEIIETPPTYHRKDWDFRFRTDGTFFMEGNNYEEDYTENKEKESKFYGLGNYEVKDTRENEIDLRIFGFLRKFTTENYMGGDCNGCGRDCNLVKNPDPNNTEKVFQEFITIRSTGNGYTIINSKKTNHLSFDKLDMVIYK